MNMDDKHYKSVVVALLLLLLSFDVFATTSAYPSLSLDKWFVQIYINVNFWVDTILNLIDITVILSRYEGSCKVRKYEWCHQHDYYQIHIPCN